MVQHYPTLLSLPRFLFCPQLAVGESSRFCPCGFIALHRGCRRMRSDLSSSIHSFIIRLRHLGVYNLQVLLVNSDIRIWFLSHHISVLQLKSKVEDRFTSSVVYCQKCVVSLLMWWWCDEEELVQCLSNSRREHLVKAFWLCIEVSRWRIFVGVIQ